MVLNNAQGRTLSCTAAALTLLLGACGHAYRLQREGSMAIMVPPVKPEPGFRIKLRHARSYFAPPGTEHEIAPRVYLDSQQHLESFQQVLGQREATGCLDDGTRIKRSIAERFPLPSGLSFFIRFGDFATAGFIDLTSDFHLKIVSPDDAKGYKTAYYAITRAPNGDRVRISPEQETVSPPLTFPARFRHYRLMFRASESAGERLATLLSADDAPNLQVATRQLLASAGNSCMLVFAPGVSCFAPPPNLRVHRLFQGRLVPLRFDPASEDIRQLILMPGDEISAG